jgi:filamentous hemagglutinin family protein
MSNLLTRLIRLKLTIAGAIGLSAKCVVAQIIPDTTLPDNSRVTTQQNIKTIEGGTQVGNNLFHSFEQFSVPNGTQAHFKNALDVQNIVSRVTGKSISQINGIISANGTANLFLMNPNGIIIGANGSIDIGGSFLATTASSMIFTNGSQFSAINPQNIPLLTVNTPIGLQFGLTAAPIYNQSQASIDVEGYTNIYNQPAGLKVQSGKTIALIGGDVTLEGGNLTAPSGRIELGSVAKNSLVRLHLTDQGWVLGYEGVSNFQNIQIKQSVDGSEIPSTVDASTQDGRGSGDIQLRGKTVELIGNFVSLATINNSVESGGDLTITAEKLFVKDGVQILTSTTGKGDGGNLIVNARDSIEILGSLSRTNPATLSTGSADAGNAGNITINTARLRIQDLGFIAVGSSGRFDENTLEFKPATGKAGNLVINASKSIELIGNTSTGSNGGLSSSTVGFGDAGQVTIATKQLVIRDGAQVNVSSRSPQFLDNEIFLGDVNNLGKAGNLEVRARSILLENQGKLTSETDTGEGGNITLQVQDLLVMRRNSQISTNAGRVQTVGDGGDIIINAPNGFIVANNRENSDITANAFTGSGGRIQINAAGIFGMVQRRREGIARRLGTNDPANLDPQRLLTSDITAISQTSPLLSGQININTLDVDPSKGLVELPVNLVDASSQIATDCGVQTGQRSSFVATGRGGLPLNPSEPLRSHAVITQWVTLDEETQSQKDVIARPTELSKYHTDDSQPIVELLTPKRSHTSKRTIKSVHTPPEPIVEANGWISNEKGEVILIVNSPTALPSSPRQTCI